MFSQEIIVKSRQAELLHEAEAHRLARTARNAGTTHAATNAGAKGSRFNDVLSALGQGLSALGTVQPSTPTHRKRTATGE